MCTSVRKHVIGTLDNPGSLEIYKHYGKFFVTYVAPSGSNFQRTKELTIEEANACFDEIVTAENWNGLVSPQYR